MTFEEFFIKKRIDLPALEKAEPGLFSEFKIHFFEMGEKSFDHTKKYWFNKLRHQFHLAPEVKIEKPVVTPPLAQPAIGESLPNPAAAPQAAKTGFVPRFKAGNIAKPAVADDKPVEAAPAPAPTPVKPGFTPRFKAANMPGPVVTEDKTGEKTPETEAPPQPQPAKPGFTPRFKAANMPKPIVAEDKTEEKPTEEELAPEEKPVEATTPKPAYKPRFNMKNIPPKAEE
ncbi:hypothetical protein [Mucilaginibacter gotjawali]|uniref:Uncharacterized protein n=2 Tax=Mucilaginibacter gotjawali TaxID=1550579 RepID=A0A839SCT5_9SPHI|nr:hypothetical protein [Mucilaginibacter gotjawali]MBB3055398.1 hypothetical protein [Mucilaginibacter gotjawali]BAU53325.1 hypothetical protein MgSA37_01492 [Mucilaginibacter gotjawali]